jgi:hypothetical protein
MIIGDTILASVPPGGADTRTTSVRTPWIASWGTSAVLSYEITAIGSTGDPAELVARVQTKNTEDADPSTFIATDTTRTATGTYSLPVSNSVMELVRMQFDLTATLCTAFATFRALNPSWQTN